MASEEKLKAKLVAVEQKLKERGIQVREVSKNAGKIPAPLAPLIGGGAAAVGAYGDARVGSPTNKHPVSLVTAAITWTGSVVAALTGHPTLGQGLASAASGPVSFLAGSAAYEKGLEHKAPSGAPPSSSPAG
jgi:hypothetical protein